MKKTVLTTMLLSISGFSLAHHKPVDNSKYCYYKDLEYSPGALMEQAGQTMKCVRSAEKVKGEVALIWQAVKAKRSVQ